MTTPADDAVKAMDEFAAQAAAQEGEHVEVPEVPVATEVAPCVRCGWSPSRENKPLEEDLEEYLRCVLGGSTFCKVYELYEGKVKLKFRSLSNKEVDALNTLLFKMTDHMDHAIIQDKSIKLKILYFLARLELADNTADYDIPAIMGYESIDEEFNERFGEVAEPIIRMMAQSMLMFMELQAMLINQGFDSNFWKGAGLRSR